MPIIDYFNEKKHGMVLNMNKKIQLHDIIRKLLRLHAVIGIKHQSIKI